MSDAPPHVRTVSGLGEQAGDDAQLARPLPVLKLDASTYGRTQDCVQCGLCLPACPTYTETGLEADSPRGRIRLIKGLADGRIGPTEQVTRHLDLCLDCRACETACPSGVVYHELIEATRAALEPVTRRVSPFDALRRGFIFSVLPYADRLRLATLPVAVAQRLGLWERLIRPPVSRVIPGRLLSMMRMLPGRVPLRDAPLATHYPAKHPEGVKRATVGLFGGCIGSALFQEVNRQTVALLQHAGCDVVVPRGQGCCGAIHHHSGRVAEAKEFARANVAAFGGDEAMPPLDYIVNNVAGCGAMLKQYGHLLGGESSDGERVEGFVGRVRDISELLVELDLPAPAHAVSPGHRVVTYHDACHLAHAQRVMTAPRRLLSRVKGLEVIDLPESDTCCGAAGTYSLTQPGMAAALGGRKIGRIQETGARVCVTGNPGCAMQIQGHAVRLGVDLEVVHTVTLLHEAYFGRR